MDQDAAAGSRAGEETAGGGPDPQVTYLGAGRLGTHSFERHTDRHGSFYLTVHGPVPGEPVVATVPAGYPDGRRTVSWNGAPAGVHGTLVATVIALDNPPGPDDDPCLQDEDDRYRLPRPGERIELGTGTLFTEDDWPGGPHIGVRPADGRKEDWMDKAALFRCGGHLIRLTFETRPATVPGLARDRGLPRSAARAASPGAAARGNAR